ncbi:PREDICTED: olfactory receptor 1-like [Nanorana parkeri]|uniref:olfactory receptor 1-like n=1 Tax=Nanorana parkeri TaxID=125878 RepID=UPI00085452CE|nr:PREDICTED: olfactory receptor 1-like [Nanorana parkeri]
MVSTNKTSWDVFTLMGFPEQRLMISLFIGLIYTMTVLGNLSVVGIVQVDSRLQSPMYFFLACLSLLDVCYSSVTLPAVLANAITGNRKIPFHRCLTQLYFFVCFGGTECIFLAVMAYDRYVAICNPLHYTTTMNQKVCYYLVVVCWLSGSMNAAFHTMMTWKLTFCGGLYIRHYFCDVLPLLQAACSDIHNSQVLLHVVTAFIGMTPFILVTNSYIRIISTILKIRSNAGRQKVFSTCSSHLIVVTVFYSTAIFNYNGPHSGDSFVFVRVASFLYSIVPPLLNPIVYCLRNNEVKRALRDVFSKLYVM